MKYHKGAHSIYGAEYHIVWTPRYRRKILVNNIKQETEHYISTELSLDDDIEVIKINVQPDHVHLVICIPPRIAVASVIQYIKSQTGKYLKSKYGFMQKAIWGRSGIWSRGYFVSTIGITEKTILAYVEHQGKEDSGQLQFDF